MEPIERDVAASASSGELVVQNGRQAGVRRPLQAPLTLIGRATGCDVRLNVDGVAPLHCALFSGPAGVVLRDLGGEGGTSVNDRRVSSCLLRDGDVLAVGPFRLVVSLKPVDTELPPPVPQAGEVDALRVQAAAVAAQQAALLEEESRLQQRRTALERQEEQLASHLEEKRQELVAQRDEVRQQRARLKQERAGLEQERQILLGEAARDRKEAGETLEKARLERQRLSRLRRRMRQRWKKHFAEHEKDLQKREAEVERQNRDTERQRQRLQAERDGLTQDRLRLNGDRELARCQVREQWQMLRKAQSEWKQRRDRLDREHARRQMVLEERARSLRDLEHSLVARQQQAQELREALADEAHGLENRIRHLRQALADVQPAAAEQPAALAPRVIADENTARWLERLEAIATDLADQRLALVEQWQHFLQTQQHWHDGQQEVLPQLEESARRLEAREQLLDIREQAILASAEGLKDREQALARQRAELEAMRSQITVAEHAWQQEKVDVQERVRREEDAIQRRQHKLAQLRRQWAVRRKEETIRLTRELNRCRELQRLYAAMREEYETRSAELGAEHRSLAERTLALEQLELDRVGKAEDAVAVEKRLQKIRKQIAADHAEAERRLAERGRHLEGEASRLSAQAQHLHQRLEATVETEAALSTRQTEWEHRLAQEERAREELEQELYRLRQSEQRLSARCREMQDEFERLIGILLEDIEAHSPRENRAA